MTLRDGNGLDPLSSRVTVTLLEVNGLAATVAGADVKVEFAAVGPVKVIAAVSVKLIASVVSDPWIT